MSTAFSSLALHPALLQAVAELSFTAMTPIQTAALPALLAGRDVVGQSKTGSGKTLAFALPLLQNVERDRRRVQGLILCPTRELAAQVTKEIRALGRRLPDLRVVQLTGGEPGTVQARSLAEGAHIVVGTPGRVGDHLRRRTLNLREVRGVVLDEADRMLDLGFADEVSAILRELPAERQTALFSATFPEKLEELTAGWLREPLRVVIEDPVTAVVASASRVEEEDKEKALHRLLLAVQPASALVFRNLKKSVADTAETLRMAGFSTIALHGDLDQPRRDRAVVLFRNGSVRVMVATDVAARGLDIAGLDLVVNMDLPIHREDYVHRTGRTARAGRAGVAWSFVTPGQLPRLAEVAGEELAMVELPSEEGAVLKAQWGTLDIGAGRRDKLRAGDLLGALAKDCGLPGTAVGKIEILDRWAFVAIDIGFIKAAREGLLAHGVKGRKVTVERVG